MKEFVTIGYSYSELDDAAKEKVKQWYLEDPVRNDMFYEDIMYYLSENFPKSELKVMYSLSSCQGDGLNIYGKVNLYDFLEKWDASDKVKKSFRDYLNFSKTEYEFTTNIRYCFSCKFMDKREIDYLVEEMTDALRTWAIPFDSILIHTFFEDMFDYFESLDKKFEKDGYKYLYEVEDEEISETCEINEWYFTKEGEFIG